MLIAVRKSDSDLDEMCDLKTLKQWARTGQLQPHHQVREEGSWVEARHAKMLKGIFTATAWDVPEDVLWTPQPKSALSKKPNGSVENASSVSAKDTASTTSQSTRSNIQGTLEHPSTSTPIQPISRQNSKGPTATSKVSSPSSRVTSSTSDFDAEVRREYERSKPQHLRNATQADCDIDSDAAQAPDKPQRQQKIPTTSVQRTQTNTGLNTQTTPASSKSSPHASQKWNPELDIKDQLGLLVDEVPAKSNFSYIRLMILVVPGAFILFMIRSFVVSEAQTVFPDATGSTSQQTESIDSDVTLNAPVPTNTQSDTLYTLETELKGRLRGNAQQVTPEQTLSDALRVDLEYVGLEIARIDARVLKWKGRLLDQPRVATIEVVVESGGEMEREFILAALVVAKYSVRYYLEMPKFTLGVRDGDRILKKVISTEKAQFLYLQPGSLKEFIEHLSEAPANPE